MKEDKFIKKDESIEKDKLNKKPWWESKWYLEWERLAKRDYHGKRPCAEFGY